MGFVSRTHSANPRDGISAHLFRLSVFLCDAIRAANGLLALSDKLVSALLTQPLLQIRALSVDAFFRHVLVQVKTYASEVYVLKPIVYNLDKCLAPLHKLALS